MKLYTATAMGCTDDWPILPGLSHYGQPELIKVLWYPFEEWSRKVYFYASNRRKAARQCENAGLRVRDLNDGSPVKTVPACIASISNL